MELFNLLDLKNGAYQSPFYNDSPEGERMRNLIRPLTCMGRVTQKLSKMTCMRPENFATVTCAILASPMAMGIVDAMRDMPDSVEDLLALVTIKGALSLAMAIVPTVGAEPDPNFKSTPKNYIISADSLARVRGWHGSLKKKMANINNLTDKFIADATAFGVPPNMVSQVQQLRDILVSLVTKCEGTVATKDDFTYRNRVLGETIEYILGVVRGWCIGQCAMNLMDISDLNQLGFLMPGQTSGFKAKAVATTILACVKIRVLDMDNFIIILDQSSGKTAPPSHYGWPEGVDQAVIVILTADGVEIYRQMTTRLHTTISLPAEYRGKLLIAKAAFLRHVDDVPNFGNEPTFTIPLNTEDLHNVLERQKLDEIEEHLTHVDDIHEEHVDHIQTLQERIAELEAQIAAQQAAKK